MTNMKTVQLSNRMNGYMVKSDKFKTDLIGIYIKRRLTKEEVGLNTLLSRLIIRGTETYNTTKKLNTYLESCYGMILVSDVVKYGDHHILQLKLQFPDPKHILDKDIFQNAVNMLHEILFKPLLVDGLFKASYFEQEKNHLIDEITSRINDKMSYSIERCIECMYEGEGYANYVYGDVDDIKDITNEQLYQHYLKVLESSQVDINVMGDIDFDEVETIFSQFDFKSSFVIDHENVKHKRTELNVVHEDFSVKQGKLVLGYDTPYTHHHELYEASVLAYYILAGGPNARLFKILREEMSLCYYVFSKSDKFKGCMFIGAGIESENYEVVLELIASTIKELQTTLTENELMSTKEAMVASIRSISDFPNSFINFFYTEILEKPLDYTFSLDEMIESFLAVDLKSVMKVYENLTLDTVYFITGGEK